VSWKRTLVRIGIPFSLLLAGCTSAPGAPPPATTPNAVASPSVNASPGATPGSLPPAAVDVSPAQVRVGSIAASLTFEAPRHLVDQVMFFNTPNVDPQQATPVAADGASKGSIVLSDMLRVTNNMDPSQPAPPDSAQIVLRHASVRITNADGSQPIPYLGVSMDLLLDGRPITFGQALVPMVASEATPPNMYYGNNVRLSQRGTYQVFVRLSRNALLGTEQPQAAQFNVLIH
jgi:hypothetical protein